MFLTIYGNTWSAGNMSEAWIMTWTKELGGRNDDLVRMGLEFLSAPGK